MVPCSPVLPAMGGYQGSHEGIGLWYILNIGAYWAKEDLIYEYLKRTNLAQ